MNAKQAVDILIHRGAADDRKEAAVLIETLDGRLYELHELGWDDDLEALVWTAMEYKP